jgi:hypothetical protein
VLLGEGSDHDCAIGHPLQRERVHEPAPVEEEPLHCSVVDQKEVALAAQVADRAPVVLVEVAPRRHRRAHEQEAGCLGPDDALERIPVEAPAALFGDEAHERGRAACESDAVDDPGVRRIGDDDLVAWIDQREDDVQQAFHPADGDDDLPNRVVAMTGALGGEVRDRRAEIEVAGEWKPAVGLGGLEEAGRLRYGLRRERQVGVEVFHPEDRASSGVGRGRHAIDPETPDRLHSLGLPNHSGESSPVRLPRR